MRVYAVSYDFAGEDYDLTGLNAELTACSNWSHYLESTWLVATDESADDLWGRFEPHIGPKDFLLIIEVGPECQGRLPRDGWAWIREHLPKPSAVPVEATVGV